jgi:hypothetical protein
MEAPLRRSLPAVAALSALFLASDALAACVGAYSTDQLLADMTTVEDSLRSGDNGAVRTAAASLENGLPCLNEVLPSMMAGRTYRAVAAGRFVAEDEGKARQWFATAVEVDPQFEYGLEDLPKDHELREVYRDLKIGFVPPAETVPDRTLSAGTHYLDGRKITEPTAVGSRPHLYQLDNNGVKGWIIQGNAFPDTSLVDPNAVVVETKGKKPKTPKTPATAAGTPAVQGAVTNSDGFTEIIRQRPPEKTPLLISGVVIALGAGGIYGYSMVTEGKFAEAETLEDVDAYAKLTNQLNLAAAGVAALGVATFTWGVAVDGGGTPMPMIRGRF